MTPNIASPIFNTLLTMFFLVIVLGCAVGAFAAIQLGKAQKRYEADEVQLTAAAPQYETADTPDPAVTWAQDPEPTWAPDPETVAPTEEHPAHE